MTPGDTTQSAEFDDLTRRMEGALEVLKREFSGLRTGRASVHFLDPIMVEAYGQRMPLNQLATIGVPEPRMLTVQVWDRSMVKAVEKSIRQSDLGLNPQTDGQILRISLPDLSEDRRARIGAGRWKICRTSENFCS